MKLNFKRNLLMIVMGLTFFFIELSSANFVFEAFNFIEEFRGKDSVRSFFNTFKYFEPVAVFSGIYAGVGVGEMALEWLTILNPNNGRKRSSRKDRNWSIDRRKLLKLSIAALIMLLKQDWNTNPANLFSITQPTKQDLRDSSQARATYIEKLPEDERSLYKSHSYADLNYVNDLQKEYKKIYEDRNLNKKDRESQIQNMIDRNPNSAQLIHDIRVLFSNQKNKEKDKGKIL
jgi:hypothetical protein